MSTGYQPNAKLLATVLTLLLLSNSSTNAQVPAATVPEAAPAGPEGVAAAAGPGEEGFVLRTYEVGDLIITVRDYPYGGSAISAPAPIGGGGGGGGGFGGGGGGGGGNGGGQFAVPDEKPDGHARLQTTHGANPKIVLCQFGGAGGGKAGAVEPRQADKAIASGTTITMNELIRVLIGTVASQTWEPNGGQGRIESLGTALIVWQTPAVHDMVSNLLKQIRETSGRRTTLTIDARWLLLTSDDLDALSAKPPEVDRKSLSQFTRRTGSIRGITNCFSGQLVYLVSGTKRNVVSGWIPVVGSTETGDRADTLVSLKSRPKFQLVADVNPTTGRESRVGYQPIIETPNFGALLEIRPTSMGGPKSDVIVELKSTLTAPSDQITERSRGTAASDSMAPAIDRVAIETQELATTMRVPFGKPILVGGMTAVPGAAKATDDAKSPEQPQLYLILEIR